MQSDNTLHMSRALFFLAPMDDVTDTVFRQVIASCAAPDMCFSEFVNVDGLASSGRQKLLEKLRRHPSEPPLVAHLWGLKPENFSLLSQQISSGALKVELGDGAKYAGIDLNMGCPVRNVTKSGACSALINNRALAGEIIDAVKQGNKGRLPISVKTRLGFNNIDAEWIRFLLGQGIDMLTVHLRTVKEMSKVPAHYEELIKIKKDRDELAPNTLLIANGDIANRDQGLELVRRYSIDGVMIGRGIFQDPYAFSPSSPWENQGRNEKVDLFRRHLRLHVRTDKDPDRGVKRLNKYARIYINGFEGAKELREALALASSVEQMLRVLS